MRSIAKELGKLWAVEQAQQSLEGAAIVGGGVELEGKSASIKSISDSIQASSASSFSSCILRTSTAGSRRQLSIRNNERKGESDEPDAPLLLERELAVGEGDVVIGRKKRDQANDSADNGFQQGFAVEPQAPPGEWRIQIPKNFIHPKQPSPIPTPTGLVHAYAQSHPRPSWRFRPGKCGSASDLTSIEQVLAELGERTSTPEGNSRHQLLRVDLTDAEATADALRQADPDLVLHLAGESHVDRSIEGPGAYGSTSRPDCVNISSNVNGTFHLLQAVRFHHISTDEVFGSLGATGRFSETTPYDPRSSYLASKAASDQLVNAWHHTTARRWRPPTAPTTTAPGSSPRSCSPLYGDGANVRDWLDVDDHADALLLAATQGQIGRSNGVGGSGSNGTASERTNRRQLGRHLR